MFRVTALVIRFVKNLIRKVKGDDLYLKNFVDAKEIYDAKFHWIKANQLCLLKSDNYENLSKNLSLKFDKNNIIRCYGRLEKQTENEHPIMLSRDHYLTKLIVLKCHEKVFHNGAKQTLNELRAEFWINQGRNYVRKLLNNCFICKRLQSRNYSYPEKSNLPDYRVNRMTPFKVCGVDYLGPVFVKDIYYSSSDEMHKAYIVLFTCSTSRAIILDLVEDSATKTFINSIKKFIARRGCPTNIVSDNGKVFTSQENQSFCAERGIRWKFNLDGAPWWGGFWERLVGMVKSCLKKSIGRERLSFSELLTVLFEVENVLNNRPLCFVYDDDKSEVLTPNCLLYGRNLLTCNKVVEEVELNENVDLWERKCTVQKVLEEFWLVWHREYLDGLREQSCKSLGRGATEIKVGDVVVIGEDVVPRHRWRLGIVVELLKSSDGCVRGAKVKVGKTRNIIKRPVNRLYPTEVRSKELLFENMQNVKAKDKKNVSEDNAQRVTRSKRDAAVAGELRRRLNDSVVDP